MIVLCRLAFSINFRKNKYGWGGGNVSAYWHEFGYYFLFGGAGDGEM